MTTLSAIANILMKAKSGQYVTMVCDKTSEEIDARVVNPGESSYDSIAAEVWSPGWPEPYDAEIEYLENSQTYNQYIDTGIIATCGIAWASKFAVTNETTAVWHGVCGARNASAQTVGIFQHHDVNQISYNWKSGITMGPQVTLGDVENVEIRNITTTDFQVYINETYSSTLTFDSTQFCNFYLFAFNNNGTADQRSAKYRIYSVKGYNNNGEVVADFIPVRVGTVGYMYDKVSGKLFGNVGTGAFILGPDKPTVKDYVQDGLVAMWDGEWNTARGKHDATADKWVAVVGGFEAYPTNGTIAWSDNGCTFDLGGGLDVESLGVLSTMHNYGITIEVGANVPESFTTTGYNSTILKMMPNGTYPYCAEYCIRVNIPNSWWAANTATQSRLVPAADHVRKATTSYSRAIDSSERSDTLMCFNGVQISSSMEPLWGKSTGTFTKFEIGHNTAGGSTYDFVGDINFIRIYNRALSQSEITQNHSIDQQRFGFA